jgi:hypothetical protein
MLINPRPQAIAIASVRPIAFNFFKIDLTWFFTVYSLMWTACPISLLLLPSAICFRISSSRSDNYGCAIESTNLAVRSRGSEDFPANTSRIVSQTWSGSAPFKR